MPRRRQHKDHSLKFKCCIWLAYAELYEHRFVPASRMLRQLELMLRLPSVRALLGNAEVQTVRFRLSKLPTSIY